MPKTFKDLPAKSQESLPNSKTIGNNSKRGFASHPENINVKGRPPLGSSMAELMNEHLSMTTVVQGKEIRTMKLALIAEIAKRALSGDYNAYKLIWNYLDGMPKDKLQIVDENDKNVELSSVTPDQEAKLLIAISKAMLKMNE